MPHRLLRVIILSVSGTVLFLSPLLAQNLTPVYSANEPQRALKEGKVLRALRVPGTPPTVDGRISDEVWRLAEVGGDLISARYGQRQTDDRRHPRAGGLRRSLYLRRGDGARCESGFDLRRPRPSRRDATDRFGHGRLRSAPRSSDGLRVLH